ncbi:hypothetical protein Tco_1041683 [Tanacetum coccineum]|uniref:Uncharacterized protein n=1 Tax=Tanacetum coccineum TaxID=301880 RepID=A0ABQ5GHV3_9ASTR
MLLKNTLEYKTRNVSEEVEEEIEEEKEEEVVEVEELVLGKPFVEVSNVTYDPSLGIVKFTNEVDEIAYQMPHKIEQFRLLSNMEKSISNQSTLGMMMIKEEE